MRLTDSNIIGKEQITSDLQLKCAIWRSAIDLMNRGYSGDEVLYYENRESYEMVNEKTYDILSSEMLKEKTYDILSRVIGDLDGAYPKNVFYEIAYTMKDIYRCGLFSSQILALDFTDTSIIRKRTPITCLEDYGSAIYGATMILLHKHNHCNIIDVYHDDDTYQFAEGIYDRIIGLNFRQHSSFEINRQIGDLYYYHIDFNIH